MSEIGICIVIKEQTAANTLQVLKNCQSWLEIDAKYAHSNSRVKAMLADVNLVMHQLRQDADTLGKHKITVNTDAQRENGDEFERMGN